MNAFAERWVQSVRNECLNRLILFGERSLRYALDQYLEHYHHERPHQGLDSRLIEESHDTSPHGEIRCRERIGGVLKFYYREAG